MSERRAVEKFRSFLHAINKLMTRDDESSEDRRHTLDGEAAQVGLVLEDEESKGQPPSDQATPGGREVSR